MDDLTKMSPEKLRKWVENNPNLQSLSVRYSEAFDELARRLAAAEARAEQLEKNCLQFSDLHTKSAAERDEWERRAVRAEHVVMQCRGHLDGCSHGYPDELWDATGAIVEDAERARAEGRA